MPMTVEQAKQAVAECFGKKDWRELARHCTYETMCDLWEGIADDLGAELEKHRWIPVEERLPDLGLPIEFVCISEAPYEQRLISGTLYDNENWKDGPYFRSERFNAVYTYPKSAVTHWRYLPELP